MPSCRGDWELECFILGDNVHSNNKSAVRVLLLSEFYGCWSLAIHCWFSVANYHKLGGLNHHPFIILHLGWIRSLNKEYLESWLWISPSYDRGVGSCILTWSLGLSS